MEKNYKIVPFDIEKAKAGAEVVTVKDNLKVEIIRYSYKWNFSDEFSILAIVNFNSGLQAAYTYFPNGKLFEKEPHDFDLRIREEIKTRRMTNQELSWWLRDCPEEHRERTIKGVFVVYDCFNYPENEAQIDCGGDILIRSNGGEWREPLIEIEEE